MKPLSRKIEARLEGIHAKKTAGLDRARELLRTLPPEVSIKLDQKELKTGIAIMNKKRYRMLSSNLPMMACIAGTDRTR